MSGDDQRARESFASILSYYKHNRSSLENVPGWVNERQSEDIIVGLSSSTVPSAEQTEQYKAELKELLAVQEIIKKLTDSEKEVMSKAANTSKARRKAETSEG